MKCLQVTFTELYEAEGAFDKEYISPGGGIFPKYLVLSYDLETKTVVLPREWLYTETGGTMENGRTHFQDEFLCSYNRIIFRKGIVKKVDFVEVDYDPDEFKPNEDLAVMTLRVVRHKKDQADALIEKYRSANVIVAARSRESRFTRTNNSKVRKHNQYLYELIVKKSAWRDFTNEVFKTRLILENKRFAVSVDENGGVFPKQLANFK